MFREVGVSLSGGLDSSIVAYLAREELDHLESFAVGMEGSADLEAARVVARRLGTRHHEYVSSAREVISALPEVIYALESCDVALVRSAAPNYFLARLAAEHVKVILTGEGADELYGGYAYLRALDEGAALEQELLHITGALHNTNLQRADRMSMAFGLEARVPFLDAESVALAFEIPAAWKLATAERPEKALSSERWRCTALRCWRCGRAICIRPSPTPRSGLNWCASWRTSRASPPR